MYPRGAQDYQNTLSEVSQDSQRVSTSEEEPHVFEAYPSRKTEQSFGFRRMPLPLEKQNLSTTLGSSYWTGGGDVTKRQFTKQSSRTAIEHTSAYWAPVLCLEDIIVS